MGFVFKNPDLSHKWEVRFVSNFFLTLVAQLKTGRVNLAKFLAGGLLNTSKPYKCQL